MLTIDNVLTADQVLALGAIIDDGEWIDGNETSGHQSRLAKRNMQLREGSDAARAGGERVMAALSATPGFIASALPLKVFPPLFNRYAGGQMFGAHVDNAIRQLRGSDFRIRSDLSATLFLSDPDEYDGGELIVEDLFGQHSVKLPAGSLVLYPASSVHRVTPVTRGARVASFFWIQSMVRDDAAREQLYRLDLSIQALTARISGDDPVVIDLTNLYHNLLRRWADA